MKRLFLAAILGSIVLLPVPSRALDTPELIKDTAEAVSALMLCDIDYSPVLNRTLSVIEQRLSLLHDDIDIYRKRIMREAERRKGAPCFPRAVEVYSKSARIDQDLYEVDTKLMRLRGNR